MVRYIDFCLAHGYSRFGKMSNSAGRQLTRWYQAQALFGIQAYCWHAEESQRDFLNSDNLGKTLVYECLSLMTLRVPRHESWRYHRCWKNILALFSGTVTFAEQIVSLFACHVESSYIQIIIYIYIIDIIVSQYIVYDKIVLHSHPSVALRLEQLRTRRFAWRLGHSDSTCDDFAVAVLRALGNIWKQGHLRFRWKFPKNCVSFADQTAWACENTDMVCASRSWLHRSKVTSLTASHADWRKPPEALGNHRKSFAPVSEASCRWAPSTLFLLRVI